jgi:hypothetical protein
LPVFGVDLIEGSEVKNYQAYKVEDVVNHIFVEQYLKHFMPKDEFKRRFSSGKND